MVRNLLLVVLVACIMLGITTGASAWDGQRQGFILGMSLGSGLNSSKLGYMWDGQIGYAPNNLLQVYLMDRESWGGGLLRITGLGGTYSLKPKAPSLFVVGGLGLTRRNDPTKALKSLFEGELFQSIEEAVGKTGAGLIVGGGYEFARHLSAEGHLLLSTTKHMAIRLTVNLLGY